IQKVSQGLSQFASFRRSLKTTSATRFPSYQLFPSIRKMMVDTEATANRGLTNTPLTEKEDDGGYASGGWKREDGKLSCGYSSFRGKRASMEDFYDVKTCEINGQTVCLFGIFDGYFLSPANLMNSFSETISSFMLFRSRFNRMPSIAGDMLTKEHLGHGGSRAAEYLKENLFKNLLNHPEFLTNTKQAISETYQKTDSEFLESGKDTFRDDGSTASTAVLVGNHLYVANVGDSRTVISKAGKEFEMYVFDMIDVLLALSNISHIF
ncbi:probable protein phosphatase 2C 76, partial [Tanacetum coccineum]